MLFRTVKVEYASTRSSGLQLPVINPNEEQKLARAIARSGQETTRVNLESFVTNASTYALFSAGFKTSNAFVEMWAGGMIPELACFIKPYESLKGQGLYFCGFYVVFFGVWMSFLESVFLIKVNKAKGYEFFFHAFV
ncbi:hypothetical protein FXO38_19014 [Capsicum annuum]|nr:hypothetical protein FXO37_32466 [Capsicum annuum]KAF3646740.1 hypothetical protein FXO38_19014 [Capsicum annuum]